jgi:hypothetical protein
MRDPHPGIMRRALIGLLGMPVGELRNLDPLATACAADGRWSFLLIVVPLSVAGRRWLPARCHNSHTDSELVFLARQAALRYSLIRPWTTWVRLIRAVTLTAWPGGVAPWNT